jgi:hypothetical protein
VEEPEDQEKQVRRGEKEERERERGGGRRRRSEEAQNTRAQLNNARGRATRAAWRMWFEFEFRRIH